MKTSDCFSDAGASMKFELDTTDGRARRGRLGV